MSSEEPSSLPISKLPAEWQQNDRLDVLFGPVRNKNVNPMDWENKLKFWQESIEVYCAHNKLYVFTPSRLEKFFIHNRRTPVCFKDIFEGIVQTRDVIPHSEFIQKPETTWSGWATSTLVKKPLSWTFNKMKNSIVSTNILNIDFVHVKVVQQDAKKILETIPDNFRNTVLEIKDFAKHIGFEDLENVKILLHHLAKEENVSVRECLHHGKQLVLLRFGNVSKPLQDIDEQIYILTKEEEILQDRVGCVEGKIKDLHNEAKNHLTQGNKHMAKTVLRKKKLQEKSIECLEKNLFNVSTLLHNLEDTAQNHNVFKTYKIAIDNLKVNLEKLNIDNVDETMAQLGELIDTNTDIQSTLGQSFDASSEDDLEAELAALLLEDKDTSNTQSPKSQTSDDIQLPSVPNSPNAYVEPNNEDATKPQATQD